MPSTFLGLNIGTTGLYTYQAALNTTAHNISNEKTEGYSRQVINQRAGNAISLGTSYGMIGTGVDVTSITQERNIYYDQKYWKNSTIYGEYSSKDGYMTEVQTYLNEVNMEGFTTSLNYFNNSLQSLSTNPSSTSVRTQVTSYGQGITEYFNTLYSNLQSLQEECNTEVKNQVDQINSIAKQVANLNNQINTLENVGGTANDLRDQRALLVDDLSKIVNVSVKEEVVGAGVGINSYTVKINGQTLVDTNNYNTLTLVPRKDKINQNDIDGLYDLEWTSNGQAFSTSDPMLGGTLKALYEVRDGNNGENLHGNVSAATGTPASGTTPAILTSVTLNGTNVNEMSKLNIPTSGTIVIGNREFNYTKCDVKAPDATMGETTYSYTFTLQSAVGVVSDITGKTAKVGDSIDYKGLPYYMGQLNEFVRTYSKAFNTIHKTGEDLSGNKGLDFFTGGNSISSFTSDNDYRFLTAGNCQVSDKVYKDPNLIAIASDTTTGVENTKILKELIAISKDKTLFKQGTPASFLQTIVGDVGIDAKSAENFSSSQNDILSMIQNQRLSVSGVDSEEEGMNLIRYQNAYKLSCKVINVMNEIYDKLINEMGV